MSEKTPQKTLPDVPDRGRNLRQHLFAWIFASLLIGLGSVGVIIATAYAHTGNLWLQEQFHGWVLLLVPALFALVVWLTHYFFPGAQGSGVPQTMAAAEDSDDTKKSNLLSLRILAGKTGMMLGGLFAGGSIGTEGPAVQIGASVSHAFYGYGPFKTAAHRKMLILAGGAAGIAATFNTPLAGIVFAMEGLNRNRSLRAFFPTPFAVALSCMVSLALLGNYTYYDAINVSLDLPEYIRVIPVCGVIGGVLGGLFSLTIQKFTYFLPVRTKMFIHQHPYVFAAFCGLVVAAMGLITGGMTFGTGFQPTKMTLDADSSLLLWYYGICKFLATLFSVLSGIPGGLFAPNLSVGAGLGDTISAFFPSIAPHSAIIILFMAAYLSGVTRSPLTSFIITMETTGSYHLLLALLAVSMLASGVSRLIAPSPLYHTLEKRYAYN